MTVATRAGRQRVDLDNEIAALRNAVEEELSVVRGGFPAPRQAAVGTPFRSRLGSALLHAQWSFGRRIRRLRRRLLRRSMALVYICVLGLSVLVGFLVGSM